MQKQTETTERTRQNLTEAFWDLYTTRRIEKITVREITNKAGYNRGTFYEYFRDVYDVLEHIENQSMPTIDELPPLMDKNTNSAEFTSSFMNLFREKYKYYHVLLGEKGDPAFQRKLKDRLKASLIQAISNKTEIDLLKLDLMFEYILSGLIGIMIYSFKIKPNMSDEQFVSLVYPLVQNEMVGELRTLIK